MNTLTQLFEQVDSWTNIKEKDKTIQKGFTLHYSASHKVWAAWYGLRKMPGRNFGGYGATPEEAITNLLKKLNQDASA